MVDGKDIEVLRDKVDRYIAMDRLFNDDGSVRTVEEVRSYRSRL
jgi:hypothetical protein